MSSRTAAMVLSPAAAVGSYQVIEKLYASANSSVCRARHTETGQTVILKICSEQALARGGSSRYSNELTIIQAISGERVIRCLGLEKAGDHVMLVLEDVGGRSLRELMAGRPLALKQALHYAALIAEGLNEIHAAHVIHKDINPQNIVINENSGVLKIIDFDASTVLSREQRAIATPALLVGTLPYLSPEQTGRMNRAIDYRCDFYSLGATLYEMLAGQPPFSAEDPLDLVHLHIAKPPVPPHALNPAIPRIVSEIVLRLLAKTAEERYQSAFGIKADLDECLRRLDEAGVIADFPLAQRDRPHQFRMPQKLYGREQEVESLLRCFDRVAQGGREILLISGYSGVGKTSLVREIYRPITERRGYFISAKFNQFQRGAPLKPFFDGLRELIRQLLTENEAQLAHWRETLLGVLGTNAQLVIDALPELELIIGAQPPVAKLGPVETQNRMHVVFADFIQAFCRPHHPLVLFFDDLQWVDSSSLAFLLRLLKDDSIRSLMIIGTYRSNEVDATHPLMIGLQTYKNGDGVVDTIELEPLTSAHVRALVADALYCEESEVHALAELIIQKTGGNPFFVEEFLKTLYSDGLLSFDPQRGHWNWDANQAQARHITDNVADVMTARLERLSPDTKRALALAACLGDRFDLGTLAGISRRSPEQTIRALRQALEAGLVEPIGSSSAWLLGADAIGQSQACSIECQFSHDRVQLAAYSLTPENTRPAVHKAIGEFLLANMAAHQLDDKAFDIVNHFNYSLKEITDAQQLKALVELTVHVAHRAKYSGANDVAYRFVRNMIERLPESYWQTEYSLTFALYAAGAEAALGCGKYGEMDALARIALAHARDVLDKVQIYEIKIAAESRLGRFGAAIALAIEALRWLDFYLPAKSSWLRVLWSMWKLKLTMRGKTDEELLRMNNALDPRSAAQRRLSQLVGDAAYWSDPNMLMLNNFEANRAAIKRRQPLSSNRISAYGMILNSEFGDIGSAYRFGALALRLVNQPGYELERSRTYGNIYGTIEHWKRPAREVLPALLESYRSGLEYGQLYFAASGALNYCYVSFHCGKELSALHEDFAKYNDIIKRKLQCLHIYHINALYYQALLNLLGKSSDPCSLSGEAGKEEALLREWEATGQNTVLHTYYFLKQYLAFHFGRFEGALWFGERAKGLERSAMGAPTTPVSVFYDSLVRLALYPAASAYARRKIMKGVRYNQKRMRHWADHAPANYEHKFVLVAAELARVHGNDVAAMDAYERAIALARENQYMQEEALANELAGKFHFARGTKSIAAMYLHRAILCYQKWGAATKAEHLHRLYPQFASAPGATLFDMTTSGTVSGGFTSSSFDMRALAKALKEITEEKSHGQLLERTIQTAMAFAGADLGMLILQKSADRFVVEAELSLSEKTPRILQSIPLDEATNVSKAVVNYVKRTRKSIVINDGQGAEETVPGISLDPHIKRSNVKSVLCIPLITEAAAESDGLIGLLYLENNQASNTFNEQRIETLRIICLAATGRLELSRKAMTDGLTDLYNHDAFQSLLQKEFSTAQRQHRALSVIMVDIDHFKEFNDRWGHPLGDAVLKAVADIVKRSCRQSDIVARYGGEEMAIILPDTDITSTLVVAERIRSNVEAYRLSHDEATVHVTVSVGVSMMSTGVTTPASLIKRADEALYASKRQGRNRISAK